MSRFAPAQTALRAEPRGETARPAASVPHGAHAGAAPRLPGSLTGLPLLAPRIQPKLVVSRPGDRYEQEADRVAEQVMRMPQPGPDRLVQRACKHCEEEAAKSPAIQTKLQSGAAPVGDVLVQRVCYTGTCEPYNERQIQQDTSKKRREPEAETPPQLISSTIGDQGIEQQTGSRLKRSKIDTTPEPSQQTSLSSPSFQPFTIESLGSALSKSRPSSRSVRRSNPPKLSSFSSSESDFGSSFGSGFGSSFSSGPSFPPQSSFSPNFSSGPYASPSFFQPQSTPSIDFGQFNSGSNSQFSFSPQSSSFEEDERRFRGNQDTIMTKSHDAAGNGSAPGDVGLPSGGGRPLSDQERGFFEPRLGRDLDGIRLHDDAQSAQTADQLHARAFTYGSNIVLNRGEYSPGSNQGRHLLAHELTHAVQQGAAGPPIAAGAPDIAATPAPAQIQRLCKSTNRSSGSPEQIVIQSYLKKANPGVEKEYQVGSGQQCSYLDLVDLPTHAIFEIKPRWDVGAGAGQLANYATEAQADCIGGTAWHVGTQAEFRVLIENALPAKYHSPNVTGPWYLPGFRATEMIEVSSPVNGQVVFDTVPIEGLPGRAIGNLAPADRRQALAEMTPESRGLILARTGNTKLVQALQGYPADDLWEGLNQVGALAGANGAFPANGPIVSTLSTLSQAELDYAITQSGATAAASQPAAVTRLLNRVRGNGMPRANLNNFGRAVLALPWPETQAALVAADIANRARPANLNATLLAHIMATLPPGPLGRATGTANITGDPTNMPLVGNTAKNVPATAFRGSALATATATANPGLLQANSGTVMGVTAEAITGLDVENQFVTWLDNEITNNRAWLWTSLTANPSASVALNQLGTDAQNNVGNKRQDISDLWKWTLRL